MTGEEGPDDSTGIEPDTAFQILGNETRMAILQALGEAEDPLPFSTLFDRIDYDTTANFSYHLEQLEDHFVRQTSDGYTLQQAGKRVVKAVLSGAVTDAPTLERTEYEKRTCPYCGAPFQIGYHHGRVWMSCPDCPGTFGPSHAPGEPISPPDHGFLGHLRLPPAGLEGRTPAEALETANIWGHLDFMAMASGVCPRCGARIDQRVTVCENHTLEDGLCDRCDCRHAVQLHSQCTNCIHKETAPFVFGRLIATVEVLDFLTSHGINPVAHEHGTDFGRALLDYDEEVLSVDPFEARFTLSANDETLTVTVDDELSVVDATRE
ncbi:winged helix-turn-helix domain-containing protein [Natronomonas amylolytica]|uniref:winged helix-turn-helix domain-containing protein n=1 Tax=Natronomonas amylolytica TaxID=3108498 RepID=UPI00300ABB66